LRNLRGSRSTTAATASFAFMESLAQSWSLRWRRAQMSCLSDSDVLASIHARAFTGESRLKWKANYALRRLAAGSRGAPENHSHLALACLISLLAASTHGQALVLKTETFDTNPNWDGRNNRATDPGPRQIVQNFGFSSTANAGGPAGEIGGFITPAGEPAFYAKVIAPVTFNDPLSASGILNV